MISSESAKRALLHLTVIGDTDIFPPPFEFHFFRENIDELAEIVSQLNLGQYLPQGCVEVLSPKGALSFRIAHQLHPTDTLLYTAAVIEIAPAIEQTRQQVECGPFSYRLEQTATDPRIFTANSGYHDWIEHLKRLYESVPRKSRKSYVVVETDISDFYQRIYFHRIEHVLDDVRAPNAVRKVIEGIIKSSRARQSYGLPVGSAASRLLAEGLLNDTDVMIATDSKDFSRYVDDFRIVLRDETAAHALLCDLAQHLMLTEGLSLNSSKTRIRTVEASLEDCNQKLSDVFQDEEIVQINRAIRQVYSDEDVSLEEDLQDVDPQNIVDKLTEITSRDSVDYGLVKILLRAIRATGYSDPVKLISEFGSLLYFLPRDFCLLAGALAQRIPTEAEGIADALILACNAPPVDKMQLSRIWVSHLFVAQALPITRERLQSLALGDSSLEKRNTLLLKGLLKDRAFFRGQKTGFVEASNWTKSALLFGASCMSISEYDEWLKTIKPHYSDPFAAIYLKWLRENQEYLFEFLKEEFKIKNRIEELAELFGDESEDGVDSPETEAAPF